MNPIAKITVANSIYPLLSSAQSKAARILVIAVVVLHVALTVALWVGFIGVSSNKGIMNPIKPGTDIGGGVSNPGSGAGGDAAGDPAGDIKRWLRI